MFARTTSAITWVWPPSEGYGGLGGDGVARQLAAGRRCGCERNGGDAGFGERLEFARISLAVLVEIAPDAECCEVHIERIDDAVGIAVERRKSCEARNCRIAEEFALVVYEPVAVEIPRQKAIIAGHPARLLGKAVIVDVEVNPAVLADKLNAIAIQVDHQRIGADFDARPCLQGPVEEFLELAEGAVTVVGNPENGNVSGRLAGVKINVIIIDNCLPGPATQHLDQELAACVQPIARRKHEWRIDNH